MRLKQTTIVLALAFLYAGCSNLDKTLNPITHQRSQQEAELRQLEIDRLRMGNDAIAANNRHGWEAVIGAIAGEARMVVVWPQFTDALAEDLRRQKINFGLIINAPKKDPSWPDYDILFFRKDADESKIDEIIRIHVPKE